MVGEREREREREREVQVQGKRTPRTNLENCDRLLVKQDFVLLTLLSSKRHDVLFCPCAHEEVYLKPPPLLAAVDELLAVRMVDNVLIRLRGAAVRGLRVTRVPVSSGNVLGTNFLVAESDRGLCELSDILFSSGRFAFGGGGGGGGRGRGRGRERQRERRSKGSPSWTPSSRDGTFENQASVKHPRAQRTDHRNSMFGDT